MISRGRRINASVASALTIAILSACTGSAPRSNAIASLGELPDEGTPQAVTTTTVDAESAREQECDDDDLATASYPPLESDDGFIAHLRSLRRIRVGLDENTRLLSARNPQTGEFEGFEVDLAHAIAERLFGDAYTYDSVVPVPLVTSEKTTKVQDQTVDITVSAVSMSCSRWEDVDFSAEYYTAHQKFLVRSDSDIRTQDDLGDRKVCVTSGSSSIGILERVVPTAKRIERPARTDCLLAIQQGEADAYFGHDTFLYGMLDQDLTLEVRDLLDSGDTVSHYGIAVNRQYPELTRLINLYLEQIVADGTWSKLVCEWFYWDCHDGVHATIEPPVPDTRRSPDD